LIRSMILVPKTIFRMDIMNSTPSNIDMRY
jgi:hypothetical protein